jgi:Domain of unknown function (DUF6134)
LVALWTGIEILSSAFLRSMLLAFSPARGRSAVPLPAGRSVIDLAQPKRAERAHHDEHSCRRPRPASSFKQPTQSGRRHVRGSRQATGLLLWFVLGLAAVAQAAEPEQFFASVFLDKQKIGQFHVRISRAETGEIEELRARASVSILGVNLYEFTHDLTQTWRAGELQKLQGRADDNGTNYDLQLTREARDYSGMVNGKPVTLPLAAFPNSIWHYGIVDHSPLFNEVDLKLLKVTTAHKADTVEFNKKKFPTERVTIKGDFAATVWFDQDRNFVMAELKIAGRKVTVKRDP